MQGVQGSVRSADGTEFAVDRSGSGPALVMVDPAGGYSGFDNIRGLGRLLAAAFTVYTYDRRGRGKSGDTEPYAVAREVEDLAAVIAETGGSALGTGSPRAGCSRCTRRPAGWASTSWRSSSRRFAGRTSRRTSPSPQRSTSSCRRAGGLPRSIGS